jgi:flagellar hook-associated protein 1 FlgK
MRSTFSGLELSKRSLFAQQTALQTTGHNVANANTAGYTRQVVNLVASRPMEAVGIMRTEVPGQIGTGVEFDSIKRIRDSFLDHQFYNENKELGSWSVRQDTLEKLEAITNEPSDTGIRTVIDHFWNAWQVLSKEPENTTARAALKQNALALTDSFNHVSQQLSDLRSDLTENVSVKATETNSMLSQISSLNSEIYRVEGIGIDANDLRDQRDLLSDKLSKILNVTIDDTPFGYNVKMGSLELVNGGTVVTSFATGIAGGAGGGTTVSFEDALSAGDLKSGEAYGLIASRDDYLASYQFQLDSMIKSLVEGSSDIILPKGSVLPPTLPAGTIIGNTEYTGQETLSDAERVLTSDTKITVKGINGLHGLGYTLENPPGSNIPFFVKAAGATEFNAASIRLNPDIVTHVSKIASSSRVLTDPLTNSIIKDANGVETVVKGNNDIALAAAGLKNAKFSFDPTSNGIPILSNGTFDEFFRAIVSQLGVQAQEAQRQATNQNILVQQVDSRRQSVSGVSMDEEMANMIKYQHSYNAAARMLTAFDEMLDKVINGMGTVGR